MIIYSLLETYNYSLEAIINFLYNQLSFHYECVVNMLFDLVLFIKLKQAICSNV